MSAHVGILTILRLSAFLFCEIGLTVVPVAQAHTLLVQEQCAPESDHVRQADPARGPEQMRRENAQTDIKTDGLTVAGSFTRLDSEGIPIGHGLDLEGTVLGSGVTIPGLPPGISIPAIRLNVSGEVDMKPSGVYGIKIGYFLPDRLQWLGVEVEALNTTPHLKEITIGPVRLPGAHHRRFQCRCPRTTGVPFGEE